METTKSDHDHGGAGWEFGTCLWSPVLNSANARSYEIMREPAPGDLILHNYHFSPQGMRAGSYLCGYSIVSSTAKVLDVSPPNPGIWRNRKNYYRVDLQDHSILEVPLNFGIFTSNYSQVLREEIEYHRPKFFPFTISKGSVRLNQGMYLTKISGLLYSSFLSALGVETDESDPKVRAELHGSYAEGERARREVAYFVRHPKLAKDAKEHYGYKCQICGFHPEEIFGLARRSIGLDCHHLDPLSERSNFKKETSLADVTVLCATCHRLVHSRRPALTLDSAKRLFKKRPYILAENF